MRGGSPPGPGSPPGTPRPNSPRPRIPPDPLQFDGHVREGGAVRHGWEVRAGWALCRQSVGVLKGVGHCGECLAEALCLGGAGAVGAVVEAYRTGGGGVHDAFGRGDDRQPVGVAVAGGEEFGAAVSAAALASPSAR